MACIVLAMPDKFAYITKTAEVYVKSAWGKEGTDYLLLMYSMVELWCVQNGLLIHDEELDRKFTNIGNTGSTQQFTNLLLTVNLKSLSIEQHRKDFITTLCDNDFDHTTSRLIDLYTSVLIEVDSEFLNKFVNKVAYALESVSPFVIADTQNGDVVSDWKTVFNEIPYLWLIYICQRILRDNIPGNKIV